MRIFVIKITFFLLLFFIGIVSFLKAYNWYFYPEPVKKGIYNNNLFYITEEKNYDAVFLGSSRTVPFDKWSNSDTIEKVLNKKVMNLANQGGGVLNQYTYLNYFFAKKNKTKQVIYFIDPFVLHTNKFDHFNMFDKEPFYTDFFISAFKTGINKKTLENYLFSKFTFQPYIKPIGKEKKSVIKVTEDSKKGRIKYLYPDSLNFVLAKKQKQKISEIVLLAQKNEAKVLFIVLPHLLGKEIGYEYLIEFLTQLKKDEAVDFYDFTGKMTSTRYYRDNDHMNSIGVSYFYRNYLKAIINQN